MKAKLIGAILVCPVCPQSETLPRGEILVPSSTCGFVLFQCPKCGGKWKATDVELEVLGE